MLPNKIRSKKYQGIFGGFAILSFVAFLVISQYSFTRLDFPLKCAIPLIGLLVFFAFAFLLSKEQNLYIKSVIISVCEEFGEVIYSETQPIQFERDAVVFGAAVLKLKSASDFTATFDAPPNGEKFFIQHKSFLAEVNNALEGNSFSDCQPISFAGLAENFTLQSLNPDFLMKLLENTKIQSELVQYPSEWGRYVRVVFDNGHFEIKWHIDPKTDAADGLRQVLHTAALFYDEIKALTGKKT